MVLRRSILRLPALLTAVSCLVAGLLVAVGVPAATASVPGPVVAVDGGQVRGIEDEKTLKFSGIRYASPPVGELRWRAPRPVEPWDGIADATEPGHRCPQTSGLPDTNEDCLFLNVTVPRNRPAGPLPVMVWLHGGGYTQDSGDLYGAQRLADQGGLMVVTVNYRLGIFGYFGHPGLAGSGTFGLADQLAALRWTQRNADAFGGDPDNLTLAGESAGGMSTCALLTSPAAAGLIDRAIISSGSCLLDWPAGGLIPDVPAATPYARVTDTAALGRGIAEQKGCHAGRSAVDCLRRLPTEELVGQTGQFANSLSYHTPLLPLDPAVSMRLGLFHRVPILSGGNLDEMNSFVAGINAAQEITPERLDSLGEDTFGDNWQAVTKEYPPADFANPALAWARITTDRSWACPTLTGNRLMSRETAVYAYDFADRNAFNITPELGLPGYPGSPLTIGAAHATELPYLFDFPGAEDTETPAPQERLASQMIDYWSAFARTGDPNEPGSPRWEPFSTGSTVLDLAPDAVRPGSFNEVHHCGFWNGLN